MQALYEASVKDKLTAEKHAKAVDKAKADQESEAQQAQLRITELLTQAKTHARSSEVSHDVLQVKQHNFNICYGCRAQCFAHL